jgi:CubicO group peptidase (beta-lactamase class C family)
MATDFPVSGSVKPGFEAVREAFAANFKREGADAEVGAALAVYLHGECVVDLWGGSADAAGTQPWARDTLVNVWSASKGVVAIAAAMLVDRGLMSYDDPVSKYWPEFAAEGKAAITVGQILSHQSGLNGWTAPMQVTDLYDWNKAAGALAAQAPAWVPGTAASYHALTHGFLAGEVIRRITGQDVGGFIRDQICAPLGAEFHIGLPQVLDWRVAEMVPPSVDATPGGAAPDPVAGRAVRNPGPNPASPNERAWRAAQIPAANGQAAAHGLGRIYGAIAHGGVLDGVRIISPTGIGKLREVRFDGIDMLLGARRWGAGVSYNVMPNFGPLADTFGHSGWGGAFGCANVGAGVGIGYVMNRMGSSLVGNPRGASVSAAVFAAVAGRS